MTLEKQHSVDWRGRVLLLLVGGMAGLMAACMRVPVPLAPTPQTLATIGPTPAPTLSLSRDPSVESTLTEPTLLPTSQPTEAPIPALHSEPRPATPDFDDVGSLREWIRSEAQAYVRSLPRRGDIIAETAEKGHPTGHVVIRPDGSRLPIRHDVFTKYQRDQTVFPNRLFRLMTTPKFIQTHSLDESRSPWPAAASENSKDFTSEAVADSWGWYGAVIQGGREVLLFEMTNSHHQGVIFVIPPEMERIDRLSWDVAPREDDLILSVRTVYGQRLVFRLTPAAVHNVPQQVRADCYYSTNLLTDCMMKYIRSAPKKLTPVSDMDFNATVVW